MDYKSQKNKKKLIFITTRLFWPADSGHKIVLYNYCRGLHEQFGYDVYIYSFLEGSNLEESKKPSFIKKVVIANKIPILSMVNNLVSKTLGKNHWPIQCSLYYSKKNENNIVRYIEEVKPDSIIVDMVRLAPYGEKIKEVFDGNKILYYEDLLSKRYERQLESEHKEGSVAGHYSNKLPKIVNKVISNSAIKRIILNIELQLMEKYEAKCLDVFTYGVFISEIEASEFCKKNKTDKVIAVPMGVDYKYYSEEIGVNKIENSLCFVGNFNFAANVATLEIIVNSILPLVKSNYVFNVIGKCSDEIKNRYKNNPKVKMLGRVDDLRKIVKSSEIFLAPIAYGSGVKTKILEAMAMGMPIITNNIGVESIDVDNGLNIIVEESYEELAKKVDELFSNKELANKIGKEAQKNAEKNFCWEKNWKKFENIGL